MYKLDYASKDPIYQQIVDQTKLSIAKGYLQDGDQLPSVRDMAKDLLVNTSTITRAYKEMESLGLIQTVVGKGTFISLDDKKMEWEREKLIEKLSELFLQCEFFNISLDEINELYKKIKEDQK
ncbi:GntR family transcriptional regulator [Neofamilia massiliensis]|uniref:GntR family transcriptional regulator n=1 Tax=Neofamilia massiliensis TaxID=1673724 RepID=UPI0006BB81B8|nr:GntR family transcriptional regulator [Neofamilia massiliensis]